MGLRVVSTVMKVSAVAALFIAYRWSVVWAVGALIVAGYAAIYWVVTAIELALDLRDEERQEQSWLAEEKIEERFDQINERLRQLSQEHITTGDCR